MEAFERKMQPAVFCKLRDQFFAVGIVAEAFCIVEPHDLASDYTVFHSLATYTKGAATRK